MWNAVHITSQVTHGSNYMLANNSTESDRVIRKKGSLKRVTSTNERGTLYSTKGSLKMLIKEIHDHHLIKLRGHIKQVMKYLNMQCDIILQT